MQSFDAEQIESLELRLGEPVTLVSPRLAVLPPYLLLDAFVQAPDSIEVGDKTPLDYEGAYGATFCIRATERGIRELVVGLRDARTGEVHRRKRIRLVVA
jgi:hypothetical protein